MSQHSQQKNFYTNAAFCQQSEYFDGRRQSPVGAQTVHLLDTSIRSIQAEPLPPRPAKPAKLKPQPATAQQYPEENYEEEQEFYEQMIVDEHGVVKEKKFVVLHNQQNRYDYIPMLQQHQQQQQETRRTVGIASPQKQTVVYHEEVDASTGRLHRYATIPSDMEDDQDSEEMENTPVKDKRYALVPVEELPERQRYAVVTPNRNRYEYITTAPSPRRPLPNPAATQKLHELLTTPKKTQLVRSPSMASTPIRTAQPKPAPVQQPPRAQQKLNYTLSTRQFQVHQDKRNTAIVAPICSSPVQSVYSETTFSKHDSSLGSRKQTPGSIAVAAFMMILCGSVTSGLCVYMISYLGRNYYLDFGILSGFICFLLGLLGFRSRHVYWLPNRNYISGYFVLSIFSLLTCVGLLVLLFVEPKPGTILADMTSGAVCGISGLSLFLASIGVLASYCCNVPPPDNRVNHCAPGFNV